MISNLQKDISNLELPEGPELERVLFVLQRDGLEACLAFLDCSLTAYRCHVIDQKKKHGQQRWKKFDRRMRSNFCQSYLHFKKLKFALSGLSF